MTGWRKLLLLLRELVFPYDVVAGPDVTARTTRSSVGGMTDLQTKLDAAKALVEAI